MRTAHGVVETFSEPWNEQAVAAWARGLRANLAATLRQRLGKDAIEKLGAI